MKLGKDDKKEIEISIKELLKKHGFKGTRGCMYKTDKKIYVSILYLINKPAILVINAYVKNYSYDNFFWEIMNMKENKKQGDSFRAIGAFVSPEIPIKSIMYEFTENYFEEIEDLIDETVEAINCFIQQNNINDYVFALDDADLMDGSILKCLAYCDVGKVGKAKEIASHKIEFGDKGRFENEGKGFFEWMISFRD